MAHTAAAVVVVPGGVWRFGGVRLDEEACVSVQVAPSDTTAPTDVPPERKNASVPGNLRLVSGTYSPDVGRGHPQAKRHSQTAC